MTRSFHLTAFALLISVSAAPLGAQGVLPDSIVATVVDTSSGGPVPSHAIPDVSAARTGLSAIAQDTVLRPRAIEYSDAYNVRLTIHRWGSYLELPLFAAEYVVGQKLLNQEKTTNIRHSSLKSAHGALAGGLSALFAVNTVTGLWNLYDARHEPAGRTRRILHSVLMLAADAGFAYTGSVAESARETNSGANTHRSAAIASMGVATVSTLMMWLWKN